MIIVKTVITINASGSQKIKWHICKNDKEVKARLDKGEKQKNGINERNSPGTASFGAITYFDESFLNVDMEDLKGMSVEMFIKIMKHFKKI